MEISLEITMAGYCNNNLVQALKTPQIFFGAFVCFFALSGCSGPELSQAPLKSTKSKTLETEVTSPGSSGKDALKDSKNSLNNNLSQFDGTWVGPCVTDEMSGEYSSLKVVISGSSFVKTQTYFYNATCAQTTVALEVMSSNSFTLGTQLNSPSGAVALNRTASSFTAKPYTLMSLGFLNQTPVCGGGFVLNEAKSVTQSECVGDFFIGDQFDPIFDVIGISATDGKLYFGAFDDDKNGRNIDLRPQVFDSYGYTKQP